MAKVHDARSELQDLPEPFRSRLVSMYQGQPQIGTDGLAHPIEVTTGISPDEGMWMYDLSRRIEPDDTLEIGLADGFSTLYLLAALRQNGHGKHTAVDPSQHRRWHGIGTLQASRADMAESFTFVDATSTVALADFQARRLRFDLMFIDGKHRFDDFLVDFSLAAELCPIGGYMVCDDLWMRSIERAVAFVQANRPDFESVPTPVADLAVFRRTAADTRAWDDFHEFYPTDRVASALRHYTPRFCRRIATRMLRS